MAVFIFFFNFFGVTSQSGTAELQNVSYCKPFFKSACRLQAHNIASDAVRTAGQPMQSVARRSLVCSRDVRNTDTKRFATRHKVVV